MKTYKPYILKYTNISDLVGYFKHNSDVAATHILNAILYGYENKLEIIEIFVLQNSINNKKQFLNSSRKDWVDQLDHIMKIFIDHEMYEEAAQTRDSITFLKTAYI